MTDTAGLIAEAEAIEGTDCPCGHCPTRRRLSAALAGGGAPLHELAESLESRAAECARLEESYEDDGSQKRAGGKRSAYGHAAQLLRDALALPIPQPPHTERDGGAENAETILAYLNEAEAAWRAARDSSGYGQSSAWAMEHGRKLIFGWRRAAQDALAAHHPTPPGPVAGWRERIAVLESAIRWALGYDEGDPEFRAREEGDGPFYWRKELQRRAMLSALPPEPPVESGEEGHGSE